MASLVQQIKARMMDPQLNENFNKRVNASTEVTNDDKSEYELAHEAFQEYIKETDSNDKKMRPYN